GTGTLSLAPSLAVERAHLQHVLGDTVVATPITTLALVFTDSTLAELQHHLSFAPGTVASSAAGAVGDALGRLIDAGSRSTDPTLMTGLLNADLSGFFYAQVHRPHGEDLMVELDPTQPEAVTLMRRGKLGEKLETVCE